MPAWMHSHCPNCNMPYLQSVSECSACGRARDPVIVAPPVVAAARAETYQRKPNETIFPPKATFTSWIETPSRDRLTVAIAILIALIITWLRFNQP